MQPGKSMYPFCLQAVNQPAQFSQEEGCLKRVNCSRILWCIWTSRKRWASGLFRGARSENQYLSFKELRNVLPNFMSILSLTLPNLSIPDVSFPALLLTHQETVSGQAWNPPDPHWSFSFFLWWRSFTVPGTKVAPFPWIMWGVVFPFLRSFSFHFFFLSITGTTNYKSGSDHCQKNHIRAGLQESTVAWPQHLYNSGRTYI